MKDFPPQITNTPGLYSCLGRVPAWGLRDILQGGLQGGLTPKTPVLDAIRNAALLLFLLLTVSAFWGGLQ